MAQELLYTSVPRGLRPGSRGFCTVMCTSGMAKSLSDRLEALSGYRHVFSANDPHKHLNPIVFSHLRINVSGTPYHLLSRVCDAGLDYTQRSNKFAHHVVLDQNELIAAGPAALLAAPGFMESEWKGEPRFVESGRQPPSVTSPAAICSHWQRVTGDPGWGGVLAETAVCGTSRVAAVIFRPGTDTLALVAEALALLPTPLRWHVTFSTYFTKLPPEVECQWRFVLANSPEAKALERSPHTVTINLCDRLDPALGGRWVDAARTGVAPKQVITEALAPIAQIPVAPAPQPVASIQREDAFSQLGPADLERNSNVRSFMPSRLQGSNQRQGSWRRQHFIWISVGTTVVSLLIISGIFLANLLLQQTGTDTPLVATTHRQRESAARVEQKSELSGSPSPSSPGTTKETNGQKKGGQPLDDKPVGEAASNISDTRDLTLKPLDNFGTPTQPTKNEPQLNGTQSRPAEEPTPQPQGRESPNDPPADDVRSSVTTTVELIPVSLPVVPTSGLPGAHTDAVTRDLPDLDLSQTKLFLLGGECIGPQWKFTILEPDRRNPMSGTRRFEVRMLSHSATVRPKSIAEVSLTHNHFAFKWLEAQGATKSLAEKLRNCVLSIDSGVNKYSLALREPTVLSPLIISFDMKDNGVNLPSSEPDWPTATLMIGIPDEFKSYALRAGYTVHDSQNGQIRITPSDKYMPSFLLALHQQNRVELRYEWDLVGKPDGSPDRVKITRTRLEDNVRRLELARKALELQKQSVEQKQQKQTEVDPITTKINQKAEEISDLQAQLAAVNKIAGWLERKESVGFNIFMLVENHQVIVAKAATPSWPSQ